MRIASCRPSPMTWLARSRSGPGSPMSRLACCMHSTMVAAESMMVPSQSNTISGYLIGSYQMSVDELLDVRRQRSFQLDAVSRQGMQESKPARMQEQPPQPLLFQPMIELEVAVLVVAEQRVAGMRDMNPNLVLAAGEQAYFDEAEVPIAFQHPDLGCRRHAAFLDAHAALALGVDILMERLVQRAACHPPLGEGQVDLFDLAGAQHA